MHHDALMTAMVRMNRGDTRRINHLLKVYAFAQTIGFGEHLSEQDQTIVEAVAICHDIGIPVAERLYGRCTYAMQQSLGASEAGKLLPRLGYPSAMVARICHIISLHHTFEAIDALDFQVLVEADLLVNLEEKQSDREQVQHMRDTVFKTETGTLLLDDIFNLVHEAPLATNSSS